MTRDGRPGAASRRGVLSALAGLTAVPGVTASGIVDPDDAVDLGVAGPAGGGWRPVGEVELSRVDRGPWSTAAAGEGALRAAADGAAEPAVARPVDAAELLATPYLTADIVPGVARGVEGPVAFEFRLVRGGAGTRDRTVLARSDPVVVRQAVPGRIYWDATAVDAAARRATDLEIAWCPAPGDGDAGGAAPEDPYRGAVVLDAVGASADPDAVAAARFVRAVRRLEADHGTLERTEVTERGPTAAAGRFVFADGATAAYRFEDRGAEGYRLSVAGEAVEFRDGPAGSGGGAVDSRGER